MNQRGAAGRIYLARLDQAPEDGRTVTLPETATADLRLGTRILFYELRGEGDSARGFLSGWGEVERIAAAEGVTTVLLRAYTPFKRRIPFSELRADPRREPDATVQLVSTEVFNLALAKARR